MWQLRRLLCVLILAPLASCLGRSEIRPTYTITLAASSDTAVADGNSAVALQVQIINYDGLMLSNMTTYFEVSGGSAVVQQPGATDINGIATGSITATSPGNVTVNAYPARTGTWNQQSPEVKITFISNAPPGAARVTISASPATPTVGQSTALSVSVASATGQIMAGEPVTLTCSDPTATLSPAQGNTNAQGVFVSTLNTTHAGTCVLNAIAGSGSASASVTFLPGAAAAAQSSLSVSPSNVAADGTSFAVLTLQLTDAYANPVPGAAGTFTSDGTAVVISSASGLSDASGRITAHAASTTAQSANMVATTPGFTAHSLLTFTPGSPSAANSSLSVSPNTLVVTHPASVTFTLTDGKGNPLANQPVSLSATGTGNSGLPANGNTNSQGIFSATLVSTRAESKTVTATSGSVTLTSNVTFAAGNPNVAASSFVANPNAVLADGVHASTLTLTLLDAYGNSIANQNVTFSSSDPLSAVTHATGSTDASGVVSATVASVHAASTVQTVTAGGATFSAAVTFFAGTPATVSLTASPNTIFADGTATSFFTFTVNDALGNPVPTQNVTVTGSNSGSIGVPASGNTTTNGQFSGGFASTQPGTNTLTASCGGLQATATVTSIIGPATRLVLSGLANAPQADYLSVVVNAVDVHGTTVPSYSGTVTFTSSDLAATLPANHTFTASENGAYTFSRQVLFSESGTKTFTATDTASSSVNGNTVLSIATYNGSTLVLETQAAAAQCLDLPGLNNQVGATLVTSTCAFHGDQLFSLGNDNTLRVLGYCVEVAGAAYGAGATVQLNLCDGGPEQTWTLNGNAVQSLGNTSYCLDAGAGMGSTVVVNVCTSATAQLWRYHAVTAASTLMSASSQMVVDVPGASYANNNLIDTYPPNTTGSQAFALGIDGSVSSVTGSQPGVPYCIQVPGANYSAGTQLGIFQCNGAPEQLWVQMGRTLRPRFKTNLCLDMNNGNLTGGHIALATCTGTATQNLIVEPLSNFYHFFEKGGTNTCVAFPSTNVAGGTVTTATCSVTYQQNIHEGGGSDIHSVSWSFPAGSTYADGGAFPMTAGTTVSTQSASTDPNSILWSMTAVGDAYAYVAEKQSTLALDANIPTAGSPLLVSNYTATDTQLFYKWPTALSFTLSSAPAQCIGVTSVTPLAGTPVQIMPCSGAPNAHLTWMPDATFQYAGLCLDMVGGQDANNVAGALMQLNSCTGVSRQHWSNNGSMAGNIIFFNQQQSGLCLDTNGTTVTGQPLTLQTCSSAASAKFVVH